MPVPEAAMDEDGYIILRKPKIRLAGYVAGMDAEAEAHAVQAASDQKFGLRIFSANAGHHPASSSLIDYINHVGLGRQPLRLLH